jgi:hypothetical protein
MWYSTHIAWLDEAAKAKMAVPDRADAGLARGCSLGGYKRNTQYATHVTCHVPSRPEERSPQYGPGAVNQNP